MSQNTLYYLVTNMRFLEAKKFDKLPTCSYNNYKGIIKLPRQQALMKSMNIFSIDLFR